jgi:hypothetical protein
MESNVILSFSKNLNEPAFGYKKYFSPATHQDEMIIAKKHS